MYIDILYQVLLPPALPGITRYTVLPISLSKYIFVRFDFSLSYSICFCFIDYAKTFDYVDHNKVWKILKEMGIPDHLTCFFRNRRSGSNS